VTFSVTLERVSVSLQSGGMPRVVIRSSLAIGGVGASIPDTLPLMSRAVGGSKPVSVVDFQIGRSGRGVMFSEQRFLAEEQGQRLLGSLPTLGKRAVSTLRVCLNSEAFFCFEAERADLEGSVFGPISNRRGGAYLRRLSVATPPPRVQPGPHPGSAIEGRAEIGMVIHQNAQRSPTV